MDGMDYEGGAEQRIRAQLDRIPDSDAITVDKATVRELLADLEKARGWHEAGEALCWDWYAFREAKTPLNQAHYLTELSNQIFNVSTYLPTFDDRTGELRSEEEL